MDNPKIGDIVKVLVGEYEGYAGRIVTFKDKDNVVSIRDDEVIYTDQEIVVLVSLAVGEMVRINSDLHGDRDKIFEVNDLQYDETAWPIEVIEHVDNTIFHRNYPDEHIELHCPVQISWKVNEYWDQILPKNRECILKFDSIMQLQDELENRIPSSEYVISDYKGRILDVKIRCDEKNETKYLIGLTSDLKDNIIRYTSETFFTQYIAEFFNNRADLLNIFLEKTESPIERYFLIEFLMKLEIIREVYDSVEIEPQIYIGPNRVDFVIYVSQNETIKNFVVECDGADYHDPIRDKVRDTYLEGEGYEVKRYSGSDLWNNAEDCVNDLIKTIKNSFESGK
jgi:very-short-patch-repair endonuclease